MCVVVVAVALLVVLESWSLSLSGIQEGRRLCVISSWLVRLDVTCNRRHGVQAEMLESLKTSFPDVKITYLPVSQCRVVGEYVPARMPCHERARPFPHVLLGWGILLSYSIGVSSLSPTGPAVRTMSTTSPLMPPLSSCGLFDSSPYPLSENSAHV